MWTDEDKLKSDSVNNRKWLQHDFPGCKIYVVEVWEDQETRIRPGFMAISTLCKIMSKDHSLFTTCENEDHFLHLDKWDSYGFMSHSILKFLIVKDL